MKYQQVSVDFVNMVFTATTYLALAAAAWVFLRLVQACFWLPTHLKKQNNIQQMLQDKVESYEKYILDCEEKERAEAELNNDVECAEEDEKVEKPTSQINETKWKERRECLEMLKKELRRVRDGGDMYDWDYLLEEDEKEKSEKDDELANNDDDNENDDDDDDDDDDDKDNTKSSLNEKELNSENEKSDDSTEKEDDEPKKEK